MKKSDLIARLQDELETDGDGEVSLADLYHDELDTNREHAQEAMARGHQQTFHDSNFGCWEVNDEDDVDFYFHVQATNVRRVCDGCGGTFMLQPQYAYCNSCADARERGYDG